MAGNLGRSVIFLGPKLRHLTYSARYLNPPVHDLNPLVHDRNPFHPLSHSILLPIAHHALHISIYSVRYLTPPVHYLTPNCSLTHLFCTSRHEDLSVLRSQGEWLSPITNLTSSRNALSICHLCNLLDVLTDTTATSSLIQPRCTPTLNSATRIIPSMDASRTPCINASRFHLLQWPSVQCSIVIHTTLYSAWQNPQLVYRISFIDISEHPSIPSRSFTPLHMLE